MSLRAAAWALALSSSVVWAQDPDAAAVAAAVQGPRFAIFEYRIEGNTALDAERIERAVYPFLGESRTADDVESARSALEKAYRDAGFGTVVVDTPEQRVSSGVVVLNVTQGTVARLRVVGAQHYSQERILEKVPELAEGQTPNFKQVSTQLAGVNRSADRRVTPLLRPGKTPGTTEVDLTVEDHLPLHGSLELNNHYSANTTHSRLLGSLRYDNLWQAEHSVGVQLQISPENRDEVEVFSGSYTVPLGENLLVFSAIRSNSQVFAGVGDVTVFGRGSIYGLREIFVLEGNPHLVHTLTAGADYKDLKEDVTVGAQGIATPIRYLPFSLGYALTRDDDAGQWQAGVGMTFALRGLASDESQFENKRYRAQSNFSILKFDLARTQKLPRGLSAFGKLDGQISAQPLISSEQFVAGGADSVRGYLEAAAVGDTALHGTLELRSPNFALDHWPVLAGLQVHAFAEGAYLQLRSPLPQQTARFQLLSTGFGLRLYAKQYASLALDVGWPLRDSGSTRSGEPRLHARGVFEF
ncbi:ShlB/FhaC/HecB family hemolysin secretion/activation protein [Methylibium sp.]|uniref:ShlB/FhaC/HecB family hemolysin secretion/activation protein n=1 Tax=Methylibium sp. TaxID=2067992 RepID=UPI003D103E01